MSTSEERRRREASRSQRNRSRKYAVFLSHAQRDQWLARVLTEKIEAQHVEVWLDEMSLQGGDDVMTAVDEGIDASDEAVVLVSNDALKSQWVAVEIGIAKGKKKRITQLLNNVDLDSFAPLKGAKSYELNSFDRFLGELSRRAAS